MTRSLVYSLRFILSQKTGNILTFAQFEEETLVENERDLEEEE